MINKPYKSINTNNYIINTLNVSEKNFANNSVMDKKNLEKDYNKYKKEKEELNNDIRNIMNVNMKQNFDDMKEE